MCVSGEEAYGLPSNRQVILVGEGSERLVKQLLGDRLKTKRDKRGEVISLRLPLNQFTTNDTKKTYLQSRIVP